MSYLTNGLHPFISLSLFLSIHSGFRSHLAAAFVFTDQEACRPYYTSVVFYSSLVQVSSARSLGQSWIWPIDIITSSSPVFGAASLASWVARGRSMRDREPNSPPLGYWQPPCGYLRTLCFVLRIPVPIRPALCGKIGKRVSHGEKKCLQTRKGCVARLIAQTLTYSGDTTVEVPSSCRPSRLSSLKSEGKEYSVRNKKRPSIGVHVKALSSTTALCT